MSLVQPSTQDATSKRDVGQLAALAALNPNPVLEVDADGAVLYQNVAAHHMWPHLGREVSHPLVEGLATLRPELASGQKRKVVREVILGAQIIEQHISWLPQSGSFCIYALDITARKELERQLMQAQKLESIGQLAAGIAHEINTPLQYVGDNTQFLKDAFGGLCRLLVGFNNLLAEVKQGNTMPERTAELELLVEEADLEYCLERVPQALDQSQVGLRNVAKIVRALREFSHPSLAERAAIDLNRAVENTITISRNEWKYAADLDTTLDPNLPHVPCYGGEINQVVLNLIVNGAHAIAEANRSEPTRKGRIHVSTRRDGDYAEIRVADTGTGIPEAIRQKVFNPFFTTKEVGKGTGQGLALAHSIIVTKHRGTLAFESEVGRGTTFIVRLPLAESGSSAEPT